MDESGSDLELLTGILEVHRRLRKKGKAARFIYLRPGYMDQLRAEIDTLFEQGGFDGPVLAGCPVIERDDIPNDYDFLVMPEPLDSN